jgi:capsular polysaccharide biosynthesis protein
LENQQHVEEYTIDLRDIFRIVRKRIGLILAIPAVAVLMAALVAFFAMTPIYQASTTLMVWKTPTTQNQITTGDITTNRQLVTTFREIARSNTVMQDVINSLNLQESPDDLRSAVEVSAVGTTEIIKISVDNPDPVEAQLLADAVASSFMTNVLRLMQVDNVVVVDPANLPDSPVKPQKKLIIAVSGLLGLMTSAFLVFLLEYLDNTLKTPADVERYLGLPVLGMIPRFKPADLTMAPKGD